MSSLTAARVQMELSLGFHMICLGAVSTGDIRAWARPFPAAVGVLALLICAYLAAVYLAWESRDETLRMEFRRRAMATWWVAGAMSMITLLLAWAEAPRLWSGLTSWPGLVLVGAGAVLAPVSFAALRQGRHNSARIVCAAQVATLLSGWAAAQWPYLIYPDLTVASAAAPPSTLALTAATIPFGLALLLPALWFLFAVFKSPAGHE